MEPKIKEIYEKPSLEAIVKWLRDEKKLAIIVGPVYHIEPDSLRRDFTGLWIYYIDGLESFDNGPVKYRTSIEFNSYEEALQDGITEALKRI